MSITGKQIKVARAGLGLRLRDLAQATRVSVTTLQKIENGSNAYESTLIKLQAELERRGATFDFHDGLWWVGVPNAEPAPQRPKSAPDDVEVFLDEQTTRDTLAGDLIVNRIACAVARVHGWNLSHDFDAIEAAAMKRDALGDYLARLIPAIRAALSSE